MWDQRTFHVVEHSVCSGAGDREPDGGHEVPATSMPGLDRDGSMPAFAGRHTLGWPLPSKVAAPVIVALRARAGVPRVPHGEATMTDETEVLREVGPRDP